MHTLYIKYTDQQKAFTSGENAINFMRGAANDPTNGTRRHLWQHFDRFDGLISHQKSTNAERHGARLIKDGGDILTVTILKMYVLRLVEKS